MTQVKKTRGDGKVKFPTGAIAWLDKEGHVQGVPEPLFEKLGRRDQRFPNEPTDFERFLGKLISGELKL